MKIYPAIVLIITQILFTSGDLLARTNMKVYGFTWAAFLAPWFWVYLFIRQIATFGQLWVFTQNELGKAMAMFGAVSIVLSNVLAFFLLKETLSTTAYLGISCAILAFVLMAFR